MDDLPSNTLRDRRVLTLKPDDKIKADAEKKLASGVGPAPKLAGQ